MKQTLKEHTRRYQKTEHKLVVAASEISSLANKEVFTVKGLAYRARVSASTFYRHFRNMLDFSNHHIDIIRQASEELLVHLNTQEALAPEMVFFQINRMIYIHRTSVRFLFASEKDYAIRQVFWILKPLVTKNWASYGALLDQRIYCYFVVEATEAIRLWVIADGFRREHIDIVTSQQAFLAKKVSSAIMPIVKMEESDIVAIPDNYL